MGNPRATRDRVWVVPNTGSTLKYGFLTNSTAGVRTILGHTPVSGAVAGLVYGANSPKPGRASKGDSNNYYSIGQRAALLAAKWVVTPPKVKSSFVTTKTQSVYVEVDGIKYGWQMPKASLAAIGADKANLGIVDATAAERRNIVFGASFPKPQRARKIITIGTGAEARDETYSTFVDDDAVGTGLPAGWTIIGAGSQIAD